MQLGAQVAFLGCLPSSALSTSISSYIFTKAYVNNSLNSASSQRTFSKKGRTVRMKWPISTAVENASSCTTKYNKLLKENYIQPLSCTICLTHCYNPFIHLFINTVRWQRSIFIKGREIFCLIFNRVGKVIGGAFGSTGWRTGPRLPGSCVLAPGGAYFHIWAAWRSRGGY